jgi:hypothetical protein
MPMPCVGSSVGTTALMTASLAVSGPLRPYIDGTVDMPDSG